MCILYFPVNHPYLYWGLAVILCVFQGIRAFFVQRHKIHSKSKDREAGIIDKVGNVFEHYIPDIILNMTCSLSGFLALYVVCFIFSNIDDLANIETGTGIIVSFLFLIAITGISGILQSLLKHGNFPK